MQHKRRSRRPLQFCKIKSKPDTEAPVGRRINFRDLVHLQTIRVGTSKESKNKEHNKMEAIQEEAPPTLKGQAKATQEWCRPLSPITNNQRADKPQNRDELGKYQNQMLNNMVIQIPLIRNLQIHL